MNLKPQTSNLKRLFGLIGFPLSHSFSQKYFTEKFKKENIADCEFKNFSLENIQELPTLLKNNSSLCGLSVTIPHKQSVIKFLNSVDDTAKKISAVNCIRVNDMKGFNTDIVGFKKSLFPLLKSHHTHALILGTGGASKAVAYILDESKIQYKYVSRNTKNDDVVIYSSLTKENIFESTLIINTTPLGMFPNVNDCPKIPYEFISSRHLLYDLTYNPEESLFLKMGKEKGAQIKNGLEMLQLQADEAWRIWNEAPNP